MSGSDEKQFILTVSLRVTKVQNWLLTARVKNSRTFPRKEHPEKQAVMRLSGVTKLGDLQICRTNVLTGDGKCKGRI